MRTFILSLLALGIGSACYAQTYIIYNTETKQVYSISNQDDAVMPAKGYTKTIIKDNIKDLDLIYPANMYRWTGSRVTPDTKTLDAEAVKEEKARDKAKEEKLINDRMRKIAVEQLKAEGVSIKNE